VTTENGTPSSRPDAEAWLDGLAGRDRAGESARDGARLRAALKPTDDDAAEVDVPSWQHIVQAARQIETPKPLHADREAANESPWKRIAGGGVVALALLLGAGLWTMTARHGDEPSGLRGTASSAGAVWRTENPTQAAKDLAARLEAAGARVTLAPQAQGTLLSVECTPTACAAVAEQLAPLDVAVDASGRLALQVLPPR
jgi:hypothetical protein